MPKDTPTGALLTPAGLTTTFRANEFAVVLDIGQVIARATPLYGDRGCTLFQITGIDAPSNQLLHASTSKWNPAGNIAGMVPFDYVGGASPTPSAIRNLGTLNWVRFAIAPGSATTAPALTMERLDLGTAPEVLSDGIEDLQVAYACDNNPDDGELPDGTPTKLTDEWVLNVAADPIPANCNRPDAVRITIIARSLTADTLLSGVTAKSYALYRIGICQQRLGRFDHADQTFAMVQQQFPNSEAAAKAKQHQGARGFTVQLATFSSSNNAEAAAANLRREGAIPARAVDAQGHSVVSVGPFQDYSQAQAARARFASVYPDALIVP